MTDSLLLLGGPGSSTQIVYNRLASQFGSFPAIIEEPVPRPPLIRNRIRKLGIRSTLSQLIFMMGIRPLLSYLGRSRLREIAVQYRLDDTPIPEASLQKVSSVNATETIAAIR